MARPKNQRADVLRPICQEKCRSRHGWKLTIKTLSKNEEKIASAFVSETIFLKTSIFMYY